MMNSAAVFFYSAAFSWWGQNTLKYYVNIKVKIWTWIMFMNQEKRQSLYYMCIVVDREKLLECLFILTRVSNF